MKKKTDLWRMGSRRCCVLDGGPEAAKHLREYITRQGAAYTIPPKDHCAEPWYCDFHTYRERHLVECFFNKLKAFRRVATRYDKSAVSFVAFIHLASIRVLLK